MESAEGRSPPAGRTGAFPRDYLPPRAGTEDNPASGETVRVQIPTSRDYREPEGVPRELPSAPAGTEGNPASRQTWRVPRCGAPLPGI